MSISMNIAEAKRAFSELVGRVAFGGQSILITRRGKPMARLVPVDAADAVHLADLGGWLEDDDPFFGLLEEVEEHRDRHAPRSLRAPDTE